MSIKYDIMSIKYDYIVFVCNYVYCLNSMNDKIIKLSLAPVTILYSYLPEKNLPIPKIPCLFNTLFGCECPGCGITRGIKSLLHLQYDISLEYHKLSFIVLFFIFFVTFKQMVEIFKNKTLNKMIS